MKNKKRIKLILIIVLGSILLIEAYFALEAVMKKNAETREYKYIITDVNLVKNDLLRTDYYNVRYPQEKGDNTFRIIIIGDSMIAEHSPLENEGFSYLLEQRLNSDEKISKKIEVMNFAVGGYNTEYEVNDFLKKWTEYSPDFLIIQYFTNDCENYTEIRSIINETAELEKYFEMLKKIDRDSVAMLVSAEAYKKYYETSYNCDENFKKIVEKSLDKLENESEIPVLLLAFYGTDEKKLVRLRSIAEKYNWSMMELNWIIEVYDEETIYKDATGGDQHPSLFALNVIAEEIYKKLIDSKLVPIS